MDDSYIQIGTTVFVSCCLAIVACGIILETCRSRDDNVYAEIDNDPV
uniref:Uncharacterized protein n=1 Tax=viral metagenome TaxID=1070528 RepID=A0A6C0ENY1_9ZZZZ